MATKYIILDNTIAPNFYKGVFMVRIKNLIDEYEKKVNNTKIKKFQNLTNPTKITTNPTKIKDSHRKTIIKKYIIPIAYLIYSYIYTKYYDFQTKKIIRINNELNYTNYKYFFDYENPVIKKVNVFFYKEFENIGKKDINQNLVNLNEIINGKNMIIKFIDGPLKKIIKKDNIEEKIKVEEKIKNLYVLAITEFVNMVFNINEYNIKYPQLSPILYYYFRRDFKYHNYEINLQDILKINTNNARHIGRRYNINNDVLKINNFKERLNSIKEHINNNLQNIQEEDLIRYNKASNSYLMIFNILQKINILNIKDVNFLDENNIKLETLLDNYLLSYNKIINITGTLINKKNEQNNLIKELNIISNNLEYKNEIYKLLYETIHKKNSNRKIKIDTYYNEVIKYIYEINKKIHDIDIDRNFTRQNPHIPNLYNADINYYLNKYIHDIEKSIYLSLETFMGIDVYNITDINNENCIILFIMLFLKSFKITEYLENLYIDQITDKYNNKIKISKYINNNKFILDNLFREYKKININTEDLNNLNNKKNTITNNLDILETQKKSINSKNNFSKELKEIEDKNNKINDINRDIEKYNKYQETIIQIKDIHNNLCYNIYENNSQYIINICNEIITFFKDLLKITSISNINNEIYNNLYTRSDTIINDLDLQVNLEGIESVYDIFFIHINYAINIFSNQNVLQLILINFQVPRQRLNIPKIRRIDLINHFKKINKEVENSIKNDNVYKQYSGYFTNIKKEFNNIKDDDKYYFEYLNELTIEISRKNSQLNLEKTRLTKDKNILDFKIKYKRSELDYLNTKIDFYQNIIKEIDENITKLSGNSTTNLIKTEKDNEKKEFDEIFNQMFKLSSLYEKKTIDIAYEKCVNKLYFKYEEDEAFEKKIMTYIFTINDKLTIDALTLEMSNYFVNSNNNNIFILKVNNISTNNSNDSVKVFFKKYNEYYNELTEKIKNMLDEINDNILTINNISQVSIFTKYISRKNRILDKIKKDQTDYGVNINAKKIKVGKYTKILIYTDVLFKYLVDLLNIIDYLTFFYEKK